MVADRHQWHIVATSAVAVHYTPRARGPKGECNHVPWVARKRPLERLGDPALVSCATSGTKDIFLGGILVIRWALGPVLPSGGAKR